MLFACNSPGSKDTKQDSSAIANGKVATSADSVNISQGEPTSRINDSISEPPFGLDTVKALISKIQSVDDTSGGDWGIAALDDKTYASLSFREKFTYHMIHPEAYSQMCDILPERTDNLMRIYGQLPNIFGEFGWSDRQRKFFKENRDSLEQLMMLLIQKSKSIGTNFKEAIVEMNAKDLIPFLIQFYNRDSRDHYVLTVLMLIMQSNKYPEFMNSISCKKLYGRQADYYSAFLVYNKANEDLIIQRATNFYNGLSKK
jgi:hypothetical protein